MSRRRLGCLLNGSSALREKFREIAFQNNGLGDDAQQAQRRRKSENVHHPGTPVLEVEFVIVNEGLECTTLHRVLKIARRLERCDARRKFLGDPKVARSPGDFLARLDETSRSAPNRALICMSYGPHMQV